MMAGQMFMRFIALLLVYFHLGGVEAGPFMGRTLRHDTLSCLSPALRLSTLEIEHSVNTRYEHEQQLAEKRSGTLRERTQFGQNKYNLPELLPVPVQRALWQVIQSARGVINAPGQSVQIELMGYPSRTHEKVYRIYPEFRRAPAAHAWVKELLIPTKEINLGGQRRKVDDLTEYLHAIGATELHKKWSKKRLAQLSRIIAAISGSPAHDYRNDTMDKSEMMREEKKLWAIFYRHAVPYAFGKQLLSDLHATPGSSLIVKVKHQVADASISYTVRVVSENGRLRGYAENVVAAKTALQRTRVVAPQQLGLFSVVPHKVNYENVAAQLSVLFSI